MLQGVAVKTLPSSAVATAIAAAVLTASMLPAEAAGVRRVWRGYAPIGGISRGVITPWYVGYYGSHYSYYRPDPVYYGPRYAEPDACWARAWAFGAPVYVC